MLIRFISAFIISFLLLTACPAYAELTDEQVDAFRDYINQNTKFTKFGKKPLEMLTDPGQRKFFAKYSDALLTIRIANDLMEANDMEAAKKAVEKAEDALVKKLVPGLHNVLGWAGWAKTGMELFKDLVVDPALEQTSLEIYANNRRAMEPADAFANARVSGLMRIRNLDRLRKTYGDAIFEKGDKSRLVPQWEKKFEQFAGAWYENQYQMKILEDAKKEVLRQKEQYEYNMAEFEQLMIARLEQESSDAEQDGQQEEDEASAANPSLTTGLDLAPASSPDTEVGDSVWVGYHYKLDGITEKRPLVVRVRLVLWADEQKTLFQEEIMYSGDGAGMTGEFELPITPEFKEGNYRISLHVEVPELKLNEVSSKDVHFSVGHLYTYAQDVLNNIRSLINRCKVSDAGDIFSQSEMWKRFEEKSQKNPVLNALKDEAFAEREKIRGLYAGIDKITGIHDLVIEAISTCKFAMADEKIQAAYAIEKAYPPACGIKGKIDGWNASYEQQRDTLTAMENLEASGSGKAQECNYEGAMDDFTNLVNISGDMVCERAKQLTDKANKEMVSVKQKTDLRNRVEDGTAKAEQMIRSGQTKDAEDLLKQLNGMLAALKADRCFMEHSSNIQNLFAMTRANLTVNISGKSQALQGQKVVLTGAITINGAPVKDPDSYGYKWETSDGKSVTGKRSVTFSPKGAGQKTIRLTVTDAAGNSAASSITINVVKLLRVNISAAKGEITAGEKVTLLATVDDEAELCPCVFEWQAAGISNAFTSRSVWLQYKKAGSYAVTLNVKDQFGQIASGAYTVAVKGTPQVKESEEDEELNRERASRLEEDRAREAQERQRLEEERQAEQERLMREKQEAMDRERERLEQARADLERQRQQDQAADLWDDLNRVQEDQQRADEQREAEDDRRHEEQRRREEERAEREQESAGRSSDAVRQAQENIRLNAVETVRRQKDKEAAEDRRWDEQQRARQAQEERTRQEQERQRRAEEERARRQEQERIKRAEEINSLRQRIPEWRTRMLCLEEGIRKYPRSTVDCNGSYLLEGDREGNINKLRDNISSAEARLRQLGAL